MLNRSQHIFFTEGFDFRPAKERRVTIAYRSGRVYFVNSECAKQALAKGVGRKATKAERTAFKTSQTDVPKLPAENKVDADVDAIEERQEADRAAEAEEGAKK